MAATVAAACLTYLAAVLVLGVRAGQGEVILSLSDGHGVHSGDVPVVLAWLAGMLCCAWIALRDER